MVANHTVDVISFSEFSKSDKPRKFESTEEFEFRIVSLKPNEAESLTEGRLIPLIGIWMRNIEAGGAVF